MISAAFGAEKIVPLLTKKIIFYLPKFHHQLHEYCTVLVELHAKQF